MVDKNDINRNVFNVQHFINPHLNILFLIKYFDKNNF